MSLLSANATQRLSFRNHAYLHLSQVPPKTVRLRPGAVLQLRGRPRRPAEAWNAGHHRRRRGHRLMKTAGGPGGCGFGTETHAKGGHLFPNTAGTKGSGFLFGGKGAGCAGSGFGGKGW